VSRLSAARAQQCQPHASRRRPLLRGSNEGPAQTQGTCQGLPQGVSRAGQREQTLKHIRGKSCLSIEAMLDCAKRHSLLEQDEGLPPIGSEARRARKP